MKIIIPGRILRAARMFTSPDKSRDTLQAVCIEPLPGDKQFAGAVIVACDGRRLIAIRCEEVEWHDYDSAEPFLVWVPKGPLPDGPVAIEQLGALFSINGRIARAERDRYTGKAFPKWRSVTTFESDPIIAESVYNPRFLREFMDAAEILAGEKFAGIKVAAFESGSIRILPCADRRTSMDWFGVLMSVRNTAPDSIPGWGKLPPAPPAPVPAAENPS